MFILERDSSIKSRMASIIASLDKSLPQMVLPKTISPSRGFLMSRVSFTSLTSWNDLLFLTLLVVIMDLMVVFPSSTDSTVKYCPPISFLMPDVTDTFSIDIFIRVSSYMDGYLQALCLLLRLLLL